MVSHHTQVNVRPEVFEVAKRILRKARIAAALRIQQPCPCDGCVTTHSNDKPQVFIDTVGRLGPNGESE